MKTNHVIREYGCIRNQKDYPGEADRFDQIFLKDQAFESLKDFVTENKGLDNEIESAFSYHRQKGKDYIKVKNYAGVIETRQGVVIEVLPKVYMPDTDTEDEKKKASKRILLKMLKTLKDSPFKSIDQAHLKTCRMPLLELFITLFLNEIELIINQGIKHHYVNVEGNEKFLKGKLQFSDHLRKNLIHKERFYVSYDEFQTDIPQNRILKTALNYLQNKSRTSGNKSRIHNYLMLLEEVSMCKNLERDLASINGQNRLFNHYRKALKWAKVFLLGQSFTSYKGKHLNMAILFPMEVLFEAYVAKVFKKRFPQAEISVQDRGAWLLTDQTHKSYIKKFRLRPDMVIKHKGVQIIADTKWKIVNKERTKTNYQISSSDMYQLFAYGTIYNSNNEETTRLLLIYPANEHFTNRIKFKYHNDLMLNAYPFHLID